VAWAGNKGAGKHRILPAAPVARKSHPEK